MTILVDLIEDSFDQITRPIEIRAEADWPLAIAFRRDVCGPRALLACERPDPIYVMASIRQ
jgi:hypothetical protein